MSVSGVSFAEAAAAALQEIDYVGDGDGSDSATSVESSDDDVSQVQEGNQPDSEGVFSELVDDGSEGDGNEDDTNPDEGSDMLVDVPGHGKLPLREVVAGYMKDADYRRKTQELAEQFRLLEERECAVVEAEKVFSQPPAVSNMFGLAEDRGVANSLWARIHQMSGGGDESDGEGVSNGQLDALTLQTQIKEAVKDVLQSDPNLQEIRERQALERVNAALSQLEAQYDVSFSDNDKRLILSKARQVGGSLQAAFLLLREEQNRAEERRKSVKQAASARSSAGAASNTVDGDADVGDDVATFSDAVQAALVEMGVGSVSNL